jgi:hypothetical protein
MSPHTYNPTKLVNRASSAIPANPTATQHPATAPRVPASSTLEKIKSAFRKGDNRVTDNNPRTTKSWNELRDEATTVTLAVVDAHEGNVTFRITPKHHNQEQANTTRQVLNDLIENGGSVRVLGPTGSEEGVRQA